MKRGRLVTLKTNDGVEFTVPEAVAMHATVLRYMIEDDCAQGVIPLYDVSSKILPKVIEYCEHQVHKESSEMSDAEKRTWEEQFIDADLDTLHALMLASNYLDICSLLDLACKKVAGIIMGKSVEAIRQTFSITNDLTPEEEGEIRAQNPWFFETYMTITSSPTDL